MLIDSFDTSWLAELNTQVAAAPSGEHTFLLIDGVFIPGLYRLIKAALKQPAQLTLLFETLPGCTDDTRDASPFLITYEPSNRRLSSLLRKCSGWPMVSVVQTTESISLVTDRLAAWCVIESDDQRFNFRFPDTRRLPGIFEALTPFQRAAFAGPATHWSYIARNGAWKQLEIPAVSRAIASQPVLDSRQFGALVSESEADEMLLRLADRGIEPPGLPSERHAFTTLALRVASMRNVAPELRLEWCEFFLLSHPAMNESDAKLKLESWLLSLS
jgi:hypothetical protein